MSAVVVELAGNRTLSLDQWEREFLKKRRCGVPLTPEERQLEQRIGAIRSEHGAKMAALAQEFAASMQVEASAYVDRKLT